MIQSSVLNYLESKCPPIAKKLSVRDLTPIEDILVSIAWLADNANYGIKDPARKLIDTILARELELAMMFTENKWYKDVIASEMGYSGPGGDAVCPLREWLRELKTQKSTPTAVNVPMIEAACEAVLELTGYSIDGDTMRTALETSMGVHLVAGNVDERLEVYDRLGRLICNYSNKIMELDGANMDQAEIPLILGDLIRDGLQEATRQAAILKKLAEFAKQPLGASEAEFVGVVSQSELLNILMERK